MKTLETTIVHVMPQLRMGVGRYVADTAVEQAARQGHEVIVCVSSDTDENWKTDPSLVEELRQHGIAVHVIGDFFHRRPELLKESATRLKSLLEKPTRRKIVINAHTAMAAAVAHWATPDALVATCHGWGAQRPPEIDLQDALAYQLCDGVTTFCNCWISRLINEMGVSHPQMVPMGANLDRFPELPPRRISGAHPLRLVTVCELIPRKGVDLLIDAMPTIWSRHPDTELHIIGEGEARQNLQTRAANVDPGTRRISFYGKHPNPYQIIGAFDLFVLASRSDNLPVALIEAMLARLPIVASAVGGVTELLSKIEGNRTIEPESSSALSEAILTIVAKGFGYLQSIGSRGENFVRSELSIGKTVTELEKVYETSLRCKRVSGRRVA